MSDYYARPRPALGFDPAPGDVGIMRYLARRQHAAAEEFRQVKEQVQNADLSSWQGQAGSVARPMANQLASALGSAASAADRLGMVSQTWAGQLATFQAEADALEKQAAAAAADQEYLTGKQAVLAAMTEPVATAADMEAAQAKVNQIQARARQLRQDYETAAGSSTRPRRGNAPSRTARRWNGCWQLRILPLSITGSASSRRPAAAPLNWPRISTGTSRQPSSSSAKASRREMPWSRPGSARTPRSRGRMRRMPSRLTG